MTPQNEIKRHGKWQGEPPFVEEVETTDLPKQEGVGFFAKLWMKLNYKKAYIGLGLMASGKLLQGIGLLGLPFLVPIGEGVFYTGSAVLGGGVLHKVFKAEKEVKGKTDGNPWWERLLFLLIETLKQFKKAR